MHCRELEVERIDLSEANREWSYYQQEISANLAAPIHLTMLFIPQLAQKKDRLSAFYHSQVAPCIRGGI